MPYSLENKLVVGISSRALFDLEEENRIFETEGLEAYSAYQIEHEHDILKPGTAFPLVKALSKLDIDGEKATEVIIISRNSADTSLRIFNSIKHYGLDISRAALLSGSSIEPYLEPFKTDLFLSANPHDVQAAINAGIAAGVICAHPELNVDPDDDIAQIRIAFDGDAVLFSNESEKIYQAEGLAAFEQHEIRNADIPLNAGPFAKLLYTLSRLQESFPGDESPICTALVTSRGAPAHERAIKTLRSWNIRVDKAFFLGGIEKSSVLKAFGAHIFFDDQASHAEPASKFVPSAIVPHKEDS